MESLIRNLYGDNESKFTAEAARIAWRTLSKEEQDKYIAIAKIQHYEHFKKIAQTMMEEAEKGILNPLEVSTLDSLPGESWVK